MDTAKSKMTLFQKINETKKRLANSQMKKSGKNTFQKYEYFELGDFLPVIIAAENELGFTNVISFSPDLATLTIFDAESGMNIAFTSPVADASTKGASPIQAVGSMHTYMRRYLYVMAYEIAEHDAIDGLDQDDKQKPKEQPKPTQKLPHEQLEALDENKALRNQIGKIVFPNSTETSRGEADPIRNEIYNRVFREYVALNPKIKKLSDLNTNQLKDMLQKLS